MPSLTNLKPTKLGVVPVQENNFSKTGTWTYGEDYQAIGGWSADTIDENNTTNLAYTFRGTVVGVIYEKGSDTQKFEIIVDDMIKTTVDAYSATQMVHQVEMVYGLEDKSHTLKIRTTGTKNASSSAYYLRVAGIVLDAGQNLTMDIPPQILRQLHYKNSSTIDSSSARTTSGNGSNLTMYFSTRVAIIVNVTAVSGTSPTLDIKVQGSNNAGAVWGDVSFKNTTTSIAFPQITATGTYVLQFDFYFEVLRLYWTIGGTTPSFTFSTIGVINRNV